MSSTEETSATATNSVAPALSSDPPKLVPRSITFTIPAQDPGAPSVTVHAVEDGAGNIDITETVNNVPNQHSDLGGLFFDITNAGPLTSSNLKISGPDVIYSQIGNGNVINLAPNAPGIDMEGVASFDVGVAFSDVTTATFVLSNAAHNLTLNDLQFEEFGARPMAQSEKITGIAPAAPTAVGPGDNTKITEDQSQMISVSALATDANPGATLTITEVTQPQYGSVTITDGGADIVYNPDGGALPLDYEVNGQLTGDKTTFQYAVKDSLGGTDSNTVTITEIPVADPPNVAPSNVTNTVGATAFVMTATSIDYNEDNGEERGSDYINPVNFTLSPGLAAATLSGAGLVNDGGGVYALSGGVSDQGLLSDNLTLSAPGGAFGTIKIDAFANETEGGATPAKTTVFQTIDIPTANPFATTVNEGAGSFVIPISALASDANPNAGLFLSGVTQPAYGVLSIAPGGQSLIYNPDGGPAPLDYEVNGQTTNPSDQVSFGYTVTNALGGTNASTITVHQTPVADTPTVTDSVMTSQPGDPVTLTRLQVDATSGDFNTVTQGSDYIQSLIFTGVPDGVTLSSPNGGTVVNDGGGMWTLNGSPSNLGSFDPEIDVTTPANTSENFNLGITAVNAETEAPGVTAQAPTSQNITVDNSTFNASPTFTATDQSIWQNGNAFNFDWNQFLGIGPNGQIPGSFNHTIGGPGTTLGFGFSAGANVNVTAGFSAHLHITGGNFTASLPFQVTLDDTYNKTTDTLEIDPTLTALSGGTFSSTGPGGSFSLDGIFNALAKLHGFAKVAGVTLGKGATTLQTTNDKQLFSFTSGQLAFSHSIVPGITAHVGWPQVNSSGSDTVSGSNINITSSGTSGPALGLTADLVALLGEALDIPPQLISGSFAKVIKYDLLSANVGFGVGLGQDFTLNDLGLTPVLDVGTSATPETLNFGTPTVIDNVSSLGLSGGAAPLSLSLTPDATLQNTTSIVPQFLASLTIGKVSVPAVFHFTLFKTSATVNLAKIPVYNTTFAANFQSQTLNTTVA
jgi:hypothetical protein